MSTIEPRELKRILEGGMNVCLVDVREPEEHELVRIENSKLIPLGQLGQRLGEIEKLFAESYDRVVFYCRSGQRSAMALAMVRAHGLTECVHLRGGINAYAREADDRLTPY